VEVERDAGPVRGGSTAALRRPWHGPAALSLDRLVAAIAPGLIAHTATAGRSLTLSIRQGRWTPPVTLQRPDLTLFVLSGCLLRSSPQGADLLLARDIGQVGTDARERWRGLSPRPAVVAVLSAATITDLARIPGLAHALLQASRDQHERDLELRAIVGVYDVRERIARFFAHLGRHVGHPEGAATRIPLRLEQKRIEEILFAGHTQATTAFRSLVRAGALTHDADGWLFNAEAARSCEHRRPRPLVNANEFGAELVSG
jgi:hypothetical protein